MSGSRILPLLLTLTLSLPYISTAAEAPALVSHGPRDLPRVALTFDLCQAPGRPSGFDRTIVDILQRNGAPATFFIGGDWMRTHPEETRLLAAFPLFELADHSWDHPDFRRLDEKGMAHQLTRTREEMTALTGRTPTLFRFPFGTWDERGVRTVAAAGMKAIQWDVETGDPNPRIDAGAILATVRRHARNGSIVIMHANGRGRHTAEALQGIIDELRGRGLTLVTVSELLNPPVSARLTSPAGGG